MTTTLVKDSQLPVASTPTGSEAVRVVQSSASKQTTATQIANTATSLAAFTTGIFSGASGNYTFDKPVSTSALLGGVQSISGAGAIDITNLATTIATTGANAYTLANGTAGQFKYIVCITFVGNGTLTPTSFANGTTITFTAVKQSILLMFVNSAWYLVANNGTTIA